MIQRLWAHMRGLWPRYTLFVTGPFAVYYTAMVVVGHVRWDHTALMVIILALAYGNARSKRLYLAAYPIGMVALLYDGMRYVKNLGVSPERVHDCDLHALELSLFGFTSGGQRMTPGDWFYAHHATALDLYCAIPYGTFIFACLLAGTILYFRDYPAMQRFAWIFFLMNVAGFITYHAVPAAPPWYFHAHGCEISMTAQPSAGLRLEHVDEVLGISYFRGMYGRSSDLYGAIPSLHVAYPLLILVEGWRVFGKPGRVLSAVYFVSMSFSAVYLDHHWVIDVLLGYTYFFTARALVRWVQGRGAAGPSPQVPVPA